MNNEIAESALEADPLAVAQGLDDTAAVLTAEQAALSFRLRLAAEVIRRQQALLENIARDVLGVEP